jgi:predicted nucleotidyltransferase
LTNPKLEEFVQKLKAAAPDNIKAVILYGSAATGEFHSRQSDFDMLCVVTHAGTAQIEALHQPVEWWTRQGHRPPLVFTVEELARSADVFAIELLDMKSHHQILFGPDVLADIPVPLHYHAIQVERELRTGWLRLRQAMLAAPRKSKIHLELTVSSISSFAALFRHALLAMGEPPVANKREAVARIAGFTGADPAGFQTVLDYREGKKEAQEIDIEKTLNQYFAFVEGVTDRFDRWLDTTKG